MRNRPVWSQMNARNEIISFLDEEGFCIQCSEGKGTDQQRSYCTAGLRPVCICKQQGFSHDADPMLILHLILHITTFKTL